MSIDYRIWPDPDSDPLLFLLPLKKYVFMKVANHLFSICYKNIEYFSKFLSAFDKMEKKILSFREYLNIICFRLNSSDRGHYLFSRTEIDSNKKCITERIQQTLCFCVTVHMVPRTHGVLYTAVTRTVNVL